MLKSGTPDIRICPVASLLRRVPNYTPGMRMYADNPNTAANSWTEPGKPLGPMSDYLNPTKTLLQLRVEDPVYILRDPLRVPAVSWTTNGVVDNNDAEEP